MLSNKAFSVGARDLGGATAWASRRAAMGLLALFQLVGCGKGALHNLPADAAPGGSGGGASTGGTTGTGGTTATGGVGGTGGAPATGGTTGTGGLTTTGGTTTAPDGGTDAREVDARVVPADGADTQVAGPDGPAFVVDGALAAFCTGGVGKVEYAGKTHTVAVTSKRTDHHYSSLVSFSATLHTRQALGENVEAVLTIRGGPEPSGSVVIDGSGGVTARIRTRLHRGDGGQGTEAAATGSAMIAPGISFQNPWSMGLCLLVSDPSSPLRGTQIYVPGVAVAPPTWADRLQLWLLEDRGMTASKVSGVDLDTLVLAAEPLLDLMDLDFVEFESDRSSVSGVSCTWMALDTQVMNGSRILDEVSGGADRPIAVSGVPFVVTAYGERIYAGAFLPSVSSVGFSGPLVAVEDIVVDGFPIYPPFSARTDVPDPRSDSRIIEVLLEAGKAVP